MLFASHGRRLFLAGFFKGGFLAFLTQAAFANGFRRG